MRPCRCRAAPPNACPEEILPRLQASQNSAATHIATHADARSSSLLESVARLQLVEMGLPAPVHRLDFEAYLLGTSDAHAPNRASDYAGVYRMLRTQQASFVWLEQRVGLAMVASDARFLTRMHPPPQVGIWFRFGGKIFILRRGCFARNCILIFRSLGKCFLGT